ncbi:protein YgfX [Stutzerimonas tarimensis]|uniref:Protein YgfX n=1 Tax=Stutzerimonas tarimensis TaxID=1507735 RepID=A0ABV7T7H8_9GAMM
MSSRSVPFECHWQASRLLLAGYLLALLLAGAAVMISAVPVLFKGGLISLCLAHAAWTLPRRILLSHRSAWSGLRQDDGTWQLFSLERGWQPVQLRRDSLALPVAVILRYRLPGQWFARGLCIARDAMPVDEHRRLRVRLKFSRRRWAAPE